MMIPPRLAPLACSIGLAAGPALAQPYTPDWSALDTGVSSSVYALAEYDDGSGPDLYAGGSFTNAGFTANYVARWDGSAWTALGSSLNGRVEDLVVFDDGGGDDLYAAGSFTVAGGVTANRVARWDGTAWTALGSGLSGGGVPVVFALAVYDDGGGDRLYAAGRFSSTGTGAVSHIARWNGTAWTPLSTGLNLEVRALAVYDDGGGDALYAGGLFTIAGGGGANYLAKWRGGAWSAVGAGTNGFVYALANHTDATGGGLYIGGNFTTGGGGSANRVARLTGTTYSALGAGITPGTFAPGVRALLSFDLDASGVPELYAGGDFTAAGGTPAANVARWDGAAWSTLDIGTDRLVESLGGLAVATPGGAPALFAGGDFTTAGPVSAARVARYACGCIADLAPPYCTLDFFDVLAYINLLSASNPLADLNGDGMIDMFDVHDFLQVFSTGCP